MCACAWRCLWWCPSHSQRNHICCVRMPVCLPVRVRMYDYHIAVAIKPVCVCVCVRELSFTFLELLTIQICCVRMNEVDMCVLCRLPQLTTLCLRDRQRFAHRSHSGKTFLSFLNTKHVHFTTCLHHNKHKCACYVGS